MYQKFAAIAIAGLLPTLLDSCIPSLHPIYTPDKLVLLNGLPGTWEADKGQTGQDANPKKPEIWTFKQGEDKKYLLIHQDEDGYVAAFDVHVVRLGSHYFMDFYPGEMPRESAPISSGSMLGSLEQMNSFMKYQLLPVHIFAKVELSGQLLKINMFDPEFLEKILERQQIRIKHEKTENGYLLTASPSDLQKFAEKYAEEKEAFLDDPIVLNLK